MSSLTFTIQKENTCGPENIWKISYPIYFPEKMLVRDLIIFWTSRFHLSMFEWTIRVKMVCYACKTAWNCEFLTEIVISYWLILSYFSGGDTSGGGDTKFKTNIDIYSDGKCIWRSPVTYTSICNINIK